MRLTHVQLSYLRLLALAAMTSVMSSWLSATALAQSQVFITSDRTIAGGNPLTGELTSILVGIDPDGNRYPNVKADFIDAQIHGEMYAWSNSVVTLQGTSTSADQIRAADESTIYMEDVHVSFDVTAHPNCRIYMKSGTVNFNVYPQDGSHVFISGGRIHEEVRASGTGQVTITGGIVDLYLYAWGDSFYTFQGKSFSAVALGSFSLLEGTGTEYAITFTNDRNQTFQYTLRDQNAGFISSEAGNPAQQFTFVQTVAPESCSLAYIGVALIYRGLFRRRKA